MPEENTDWLEHASGDTSPVPDDTGAALTKYDPSTGIGYDSRGEPKAINYGESGPPTLEDPFAKLPPTTDKKTGDIYKIRKGLPWRFTRSSAACWVGAWACSARFWLKTCAIPFLASNKRGAIIGLGDHTPFRASGIG